MLSDLACAWHEDAAGPDPDEPEPLAAAAALAIPAPPPVDQNYPKLFDIKTGNP